LHFGACSANVLVELRLIFGSGHAERYSQIRI
jgi:hypothetical protein